MNVIDLSTRIEKEKFVPPTLTQQQKIDVLDMAPTPEGWDQSDFLCAKREMKKVIRGEVSIELQKYPAQFMFLNDLLKHVEKANA